MSLTFSRIQSALMLMLAFIVSLPCAYAQFRNATFVPVAPEELASTFVRCIYKDSMGFMWFGTGTGLIRYDGTTVYRYNAREKTHAITDNRINAIIEDTNNTLWIGTGQGLVIYNREKDNFTDVDSIAGNTNHLNNKYISALCSDQMGRIWIGTLGHGVTVYDPETFTFTYLSDNTVRNKIPPDLFVTSLFYFDDTVWAGTKGGLKLFNTRDMIPAPLPVTDKSVTAKEITQVNRDIFGNMWLTTVDREIIKLTQEAGHYLLYKTTLRRNMGTEAEGSILTLSTDGGGNVWVAGEYSGLNYLDAKTGKVILHEAAEGSPGKLPTNSIRSIYRDNTGITWIGTYNRGAYLIDNNAKKFDVYQSNTFFNTGTKGNNVRDIAEDKEGNIWIASAGGGLACLDIHSHEIKYQEMVNNKMDTRYLSSLLFDAKENLWIGTWGRGVYRLNPKSGELKNYKLESNGFGDNKVLCLYEDSRKIIWIGSVGSGLFYFDTKIDGFVALNEEKKADYIRKTAYVTSVVEDADNTLWIGTLFGLYRFNFSHEDIYNVTLYSKDNRPGSIGSYEIQTIHEGPKNDLWFGTGDNGVALLPYQGTSFKNLQKKDGLVSNVTRGILTDTKGKLWISTNMGLSRYDPVTNSFRNYTKEDGLPSNEFNSNACLQASDGKFYYGSDNGVVAFYPDSIQNKTTKPVVYFTDLKLNNQSVQIGSEDSPLSKHISLADRIELNHNQRSFVIDFAAVNYGQSSKNQYCYKLEGFDDNWNCVGSNHSATYTNIDPGNYVFLVKASNSDGILSEVPARLDITIHQVPWKTWWAFLLYIILVASFIFFLIKIRVERIKIKNLLEFERLAREKEHALGESKTQFFTNISHEFRTPLSLISMPLENLISMDGLPTTVKERLGTIRTSADKMTRLVNELMDFNKLENAKLELRVQRGELVQFITEIASVFHDLASKRNIHFGIHSMVRSLEGWFDHDKLEKILVNVLSNAFKFTSDNGQINVIINSVDSCMGKEQAEMRCLKLVIVDNGIGISTEELPFIFDKFFQARSSAKIANPGTGIGLSLTKGLVELHQGNIEAQSTPDRETKFVILIPIDRQAYSDDDNGDNIGNAGTADNATHFESNDTSSKTTVAEEDHDRAQILVVEDNDELRKYISMELRQQFTVFEAKDGTEALEIAFERTPDLIISDILMPLKNGIELCHEVKSNLKTSHIPFIILTAKTTVDDQITGIATGADVYITKPFSIRVLVTHVNQIIESRQYLYSRFSQDVYLLPGKVATNEIDQAFLQKAIDYIIDNIQESQLGVDSIADIFNLSRMQVYRKIKALTGKSIVEFIRMIRVKQALTLMETHKYTLSEIAYQTGFSSSSYFTRVFKEQYGKTPSEYLEKQT